MIDKQKTLEKSVKRFYALDSRPLHVQWPFWYAVLIPILLALCVFNHIHHGFSNVWQVADQEKTLNDLKIPLLIATLSPFITTIITNVHRTIQTNTQILAANAKNVVDAYITHQKVCIENLNHIQDKLAIELLPIEDVIEIGSWPEENSEKLTDVQIRGKFKVFYLTYSHVKLNLIYAKFFPRNNMVEGVKDYKPEDIIPSILKLVNSLLSNLLYEEPYARLSHEIDKWNLDDIGTMAGPFPPELRKELRNLGASSFRIESEHFRERPQLALCNDVGIINNLLTQYFTEVEICLDGKQIKENIFDILFHDSYRVEMRDISSYICDSILHILDISIAMGGKNNISPIIKRLKILNRVISNLEDYLNNRIR